MMTQKKLSLGLLAVLGLLVAAPAAKAGTIVLVDIADDLTNSYTWNTPYTLGYSFTVESSLTFNALAVFDVVSATPSPLSTVHVNASGLNASHEVGVWNAAGTLLASATVDNTDPFTASNNTYGNWVYQTLAAPVTLTGGTYWIGALYLANSDPVMVRQSSVITAPGVTYLNGNYANGNALTKPTGTYPANDEQYFGPTMLSVPDGGMTLSLLGGALAGLAVLRRRLQ